MRVSLIIQAVLLLAASVYSAQYIPLHKRFTYTDEIDDFSYLGLLSRRDVCSEAFGSSAYNSECKPDKTLCCGRLGQEYPSCEKHLSKGWCCVEGGESDKCYVDQQSVCGQDSAVECKNLKDGETEACCPKLTTCDPNVEASREYVRCNINRGDLLVAAKGEEDRTAKASSGETTSTDTASSETTSEQSTTEDLAAQTTEPSILPTSTSEPEPSPALSGGAIGGIVAAAVVGVMGVAGLLFWFYRRRKRSNANRALSQPIINQYYHDQHMKQQGVYMDPQPAELADQQRPIELDGHHRR